MAAFKQHIMFSTLIGGGYTAALGYVGVEWTHAGLAGGLCAASGMLPDLDSASGKPVRELFGLTAAIAPLLLLERFRNLGLTHEGVILVMAGIYLGIRFGAAWLFKHLTVHRGMFHSLPAAVIASEIPMLAVDSPERLTQFLLAGGVLLGFLSHLVLDELYSVDFQGVTVSLNKAAGSAVKLFSSSVPATVFTWLLLGVLSYFVGIKEGYYQPLHLNVQYPPLQNIQRQMNWPASQAE